MKNLQYHQIIEGIFIGIDKYFYYFVFEVIWRLSNYRLSLVSIEQNMGGEGGYLIDFKTPNKNTITFITFGSDKDLDYEDNISLFGCSVDKYRDEIEADGSIFGYQTSFRYHEKSDMRLLAEVIEKYILLKK